MRMARMRAEYGFGRMHAASLACTTMALIDFSCMRERIPVPSSIVACVKEKTSEGLFCRSLALSFAMASIVVWNGLVFRMKAFGSVSLGIPLLSQPRSDAAWLSALIAMTVSCLAIAILERKGGNASDDDRLSVWSLASGSLLMTVGGVGLMLFGDETMPCVSYGALCGAGLTASLGSWMPVVTRVSLSDLFIGGSASFFIAACMFGMMGVLPAMPARVVLCILPLVSAVALRHALRDDALFGKAEGESGFQQGSLFQVVCFCMLGFAFFMGILGFDFDALPSDELLRSQALIMGAAALVSFAVLGLMRRFGAMTYLSLANPLLLATALVLLPLSDASRLVRVGIVLAQASLFFSFVLVAMALRVRNASIGARRYLALLLGASSGVTLLGILVGGVVRNAFGLDTAAIALTALFAIYFIFLMFVVSMRKRETVEHVVEHVIAGPVIDEAALARARAEVIAARFPQLSRREREVLELLLQNYSNARIADALSVSENTVKTHVRHIYGRLDLNSRQQLLALAESIPLKETDGQEGFPVS